MAWIFGSVIIVLLIVKVMLLSDTIKKHERWIRALNKEIKVLKGTIEDQEKARSIRYDTAHDQELAVNVKSEVESTKVQHVNIQAEKAIVQSAELLDDQTKEHSTNTQTRLTESTEYASEPIVNSPEKTVVKKKRRPVEKRKQFDVSNISIESVISKLGIGLLLASLGFLFKYAYDKGMITEQLTVVTGYGLGLILYGLGFYVRKKKRELLSQVLIGGSIAAFYISTYAAYLAYDMYSDGLAFIILTIITVWAFLSSVYVKAQSVSVIAVLGGLLVPFLVKIDFIGLQGVGLYIAVVAAGSMLIHFFHRWRVLQISSVVSVYFALFLMVSQSELNTAEEYMLYALLMFLLVVFSTPDIINFIGQRSKDKNEDIQIFILGSVPVITIVLIEYFSLATAEIQALMNALISLAYAGVFLFSVKKGIRGNIQAVLAGLAGFFAVYAGILKFDGIVRPLLVLGVGLLFYYGNAKLERRFLTVIGHAITIIGYGMAMNEIAQSFGNTASLGLYLGHAAAIAVMFAGGLLNKESERYALGVMVLQVYGLAFIELILNIELPETQFLTGSIVAFGLWFVALQFIKERFDLLPKYSMEIYAALILLVKMYMAFVSYVDFKVNTTETIVVLALAGIVYAVAEFRYKDLVSKTMLKTVGLLTVLITAVVDTWILTDTLEIGVALAGLIILVYRRYDKDTVSIAEYMKEALVYAWIAVLAIGSFAGLDAEAFSPLVLLSAVVQLGTLYMLISQLSRIEVKARFLLYSALFYLVSYSALSPLANADGSITLVWAGYSVSRLAYHMMKGESQLANFSLGLIVLVVAKYILIDISTVSVIWKVITSMIFGTVLLVLSYMMQPLINRFNSNQNEAQEDEKQQDE